MHKVKPKMRNTSFFVSFLFILLVLLMVVFVVASTAFFVINRINLNNTLEKLAVNSTTVTIDTIEYIESVTAAQNSSLVKDIIPLLTSLLSLAFITIGVNYHNSSQQAIKE